MKILKKLICVLTVLVIAVSMLLTQSLAVTNRRISISGTISMPEGMVAPAGGIACTLCITIETEDGLKAYYGSHTIKEGEKSVEYKEEFNGDIERKCWLEYYLAGVLDEKPDWAVSRGYYSTKGTTAQSGMRSCVDISSKKATNINITLLKGKCISGRVTLPKGTVLPSGVFGFTVKAFSDNGTKGNIKDDYDVFDYIFPEYYKYFYTSEDGQISFDYKLIVPTEAKSGYRIEVNTITPLEGLLAPYYYSPGRGTHNPFKAAMINVSKDKTSDMDIELKTGKQIKGFMITPNGEPAPKGGVAANIEAVSDNGTPGDYSDDLTYSCTSYIREGMDSSYFAIVVPDDPGNRYKVSYTILNETSGYVDKGYYGANGPAKSEKTASMLSVDEGTFIDLFLLK